MNVGPNNFNFLDFKDQGVYIVVEINEDLAPHPNNWHPIVCCWSKHKAETYLTPGRKIYGPVPLVDGFFTPEPRRSDFRPRWDPPRPDYPPHFPDIDPDRPFSRIRPDLDLDLPKFPEPPKKPRKPSDPDWDPNFV